MELKVKNNVEVTLKMSSEDFKNMMNGLNKYAFDIPDTAQDKIDAGDVWSKMQNIVSKEGFEW